jgi:hypothetical protein
MVETEFKIRTAERLDQSHLANLIHFGSYIHQHLDWKSPLDWIGEKPYLLIEGEGGLLAALACPLELPELAWIRLFALSSAFSEKASLPGKEELLHLGNSIAALSIQSWLSQILEEVFSIR